MYIPPLLKRLKQKRNLHTQIFLSFCLIVYLHFYSQYYRLVLRVRFWLSTLEDLKFKSFHGHSGAQHCFLLSLIYTKMLKIVKTTAMTQKTQNLEFVL